MDQSSKSANGKTAVLFDTESVAVPGGATHSELVFDKIGDTYFLSKVFLKRDAKESRLGDLGG